MPVTVQAPLGLTEVSPGKFVGLQAGTTFVVTSQGKVSPFCQIPATEVVRSAKAVQAVNGRLYGSAGASQGGQNVSFNFSFDLSCNSQTYPTNPFTPILSIPTPDGSLFGTYYGVPTANAFVRMALDGTVTVLHSFTTQEGAPAGLLVLAVDGDFYGISGSFSKPAGSSSSVYRATPQGDLKILATYAEGIVQTNVGSGEALIQASNGKLYGASFSGGSHRAGSIFELSLDGKDYKVLYNYPYLASGIPTALAEGPDGNLYGIAQGESQLCACKHAVPHQSAGEVRATPADQSLGERGLPVLDDPGQRRQVLRNCRQCRLGMGFGDAGTEA